MNNRGTYDTSTTNRRLGVIRCIIAYAIEYGFLHKDKVLNTDPKEQSNYGWKNLKIAKIKDKNTLTKSDEAEVIAKAKELGDDEFADCEEIPSPDPKEDEQIMESPVNENAVDRKF